MRKYRIKKETDLEKKETIYISQYRYSFIDSWKMCPKGIHFSEKDAKDEIDIMREWEKVKKVKVEIIKYP